MTAAAELLVVHGDAISPWIGALAALRIAVFRDWPYLYDGDLDYEASYLRGYAADPHATVVLARAGGEVVGASTAMPLAAHSGDVVAPLTQAGYRAGELYYFGESVLDPAWRGRGLGHAFFDRREEAAARFGFARMTFCAVVRPADHPRRPAAYQPLDPFWRRRGFVPLPDVRGEMRWKDLDDPAGTESPKPMQFWIKEARATRREPTP